jgi:hypothetical protein
MRAVFLSRTWAGLASFAAERTGFLIMPPSQGPPFRRPEVPAGSPPDFTELKCVSHCELFGLESLRKFPAAQNSFAHCEMTSISH